jgi:thioredoxin-like negative regulator of GroEL
MAPSNFNYTVELNKGAKSLEQGRLRQAEQSFKYLVDKFPGAEGGYRGLAKVYFEQEDRAAALKILREGAAALTKSGERTGAIGLLKEAVGLDPRDYATHRRLAAALALAGDTEAAVQEYARFIREIRDNGERDRAKNEAAWAKGQLRGVAGVDALDAIADGTPAPDDAPEPAKDERADAAPQEPTAPRGADPWSLPRPEKKADAAPQPIEVSPDDPWFSAPSLTDERSTPAPALPEIELENDPWTAGAPPVTPEWQRQGETAAAWSPPEAEPEPIVGLADETEAEREAAEPAAPPEDGEPSAHEDPLAVEEAAARYLSTRDPRGATKALEMARYYIDVGHPDAASDLLLQLISSGIADHDAQRLLIEITRALGKRDVTDTKRQLLVQALRLDGRDELAAEVEAMAPAD